MKMFEPVARIRYARPKSHALKKWPLRMLQDQRSRTQEGF